MEISSLKTLQMKKILIVQTGNLFPSREKKFEDHCMLFIIALYNYVSKHCQNHIYLFFTIKVLFLHQFSFIVVTLQKFLAEEFIKSQFTPDIFPLVFLLLRVTNKNVKVPAKKCCLSEVDSYLFVYFALLHVIYLLVITSFSLVNCPSYFIFIYLFI